MQEERGQSITLDAPTTRPFSSIIGETVVEMSMSRPSLCRRTVSKCSMRSPRRIFSSASVSSCNRSSGMMIVNGFPIISAAVYPKILEAPTVHTRTHAPELKPQHAQTYRVVSQHIIAAKTIQNTTIHRKRNIQSTLNTSFEFISEQTNCAQANKNHAAVNTRKTASTAIKIRHIPTHRGSSSARFR